MWRRGTKDQCYSAARSFVSVFILSKYYFDKNLDAENRKRKVNPLLPDNQKQNNQVVLEKKSEARNRPFASKSHRCNGSGFPTKLFSTCRRRGGGGDLTLTLNGVRHLASAQPRCCAVCQ